MCQRFLSFIRCKEKKTSINRFVAINHLRHFTQRFVATFNKDIRGIYKVTVNALCFNFVDIIKKSFCFSLEGAETNDYTMHMSLERSLAIPSESAMCKIYLDVK